MLINLPYDNQVPFIDNLHTHIAVMENYGILCTPLNYLGGGSYTGIMWNITDEYQKYVPLLLLATNGTIIPSKK